MTRNPKSKKLLKVSIVSCIFLYAVSRIIIVFLLNSALDKKSLYSFFYLIADILPLIIIIAIMFPVIKRMLSETHQKSADTFNSIINEQQKELAKQSKMINNLTSLYNDAVEYGKTKTDFFANISHELKTPLSVILGAIQLIDQKSSDTSTDKIVFSKHFRTIKQNCYRLVRLINNILDITRIDSGYIKMNMTNCNIVYLIEEITQSIAPYAEQKNISLEFDTEFEEIMTAVDIDKIERIALNLLSNAIKFTPTEGKISVNVKEMNERIFISIKDTGPGIPPDMQAMIFERFRQVNSSFTRDSEGTGIGLSLVKCFVELHDGNIHINSEEGKGSEFIIELPVKSVEENTSMEINTHTRQPKIIEAINIEFADIYSIAS